MRILVVQLSRSFGDLVAQIAGDVAAEPETVPGAAFSSVPADVAAVLIAAGGAEREALEWLSSRDWDASPPVIVLGADTGRRTALQFLARGASDYVALPEDAEILRNTLERALARHGEALARLSNTEEGDQAAFAGIVGESPALRVVLERAARLLPYRHATALIMGEAGTGKELLARAMHEGGPRRSAPFVAVNCSALPPLLMESELFGHERGAFADAHAGKPGLFEVADGGTLFLDEVGALPLELQPKLLRALDDKEVRRVGGVKSRSVDVRILAAANQPLLTRVQHGEFREDLLERLAVVTLTLPPLRERGEDVLLIARHFLTVLSHRHGLAVPPLDGATQRLLVNHVWPGNVRELRTGIERALLLSPPGTFSGRELRLPRRVSRVTPEAPASIMTLPFPATLDQIISAAARYALDAHGGNRTEAAKSLGISRPRLRRLVRGRGSKSD